MGCVYRVEQVHFKKQMALKLLNPLAASSKVSSRRFQTEAQAASKLDQPNLVRKYLPNCKIVPVKPVSKKLDAWFDAGAEDPDLSGGWR